MACETPYRRSVRSRCPVATPGASRRGPFGGGRDALDLELELVLVGRVAQRVLVADDALLVVAEDRLVERLHAVLRRAGGDRPEDRVRLVLVDDAVADERRGGHHLDGGDAARPFARGMRRCETTALRMLASCRRTCRCWCGGKTATIRLIVSGASSVWSVENTRWPVSAASSAVSMVSRSRISPTRMTSGSWRRALRSAIANDPVSVSDFALVDDRLVVAMEVLDRVLDRHDVRRRGVVDVVQHRGQRRRLAGAGGAGDEDQAALFVGDPLEHRRQLQLVDGRDAGRNDAHDQPDGAALLKRKRPRFGTA